MQVHLSILSLEQLGVLIPARGRAVRSASGAKHSVSLLRGVYLAQRKKLANTVQVRGLMHAVCGVSRVERLLLATERRLLLLIEVARLHIDHLLLCCLDIGVVSR